MRKPSNSVALRNESLVKRIREIKVEHPFWGYRRVWEYLRDIDGLLVNKKRVYRLMREHNLTVKPNPRLIAKRVPERPKPRPVGSNVERTIQAERSNNFLRLILTKLLKFTNFGRK